MQSNEKYDKIIFFSIGILFFSWFIYINKYQTDNFYQNLLKDVLKEEFEGIVIYKGNDKQNHNSLFIILKNQNQKIYVYSEIWCEVMVGDSLIKKKNSTHLNIFRGRKRTIMDNKLIIDKMYSRWRSNDTK